MCHRTTVIVMGLLVLAGCGTNASTDGLIDDLSSTDKSDRVKAARLLPRNKGDADQVVPALVESLRDKNARVRISAAIGLGNYGAEAEAALPELKKAEKDKDARVREAARVAISRIQPDEPSDE